jgi:hypothetical protein
VGRPTVGIVKGKAELQIHFEGDDSEDNAVSMMLPIGSALALARLLRQSILRCSHDLPTDRNDLLVEQLMKRVEALDPELAAELSNARCHEITEAEDRAVLIHGRHILAVIEGRGFNGDGNVWQYEDDSQWVRLIEGEKVQ